MFQTKDQIGNFFYFPSINFHKAAGGFGPIRVYNRIVIAMPFPKLEAEFNLLIGDWIFDSYNVFALKILFMVINFFLSLVSLMLTLFFFWTMKL